MSCRESHSLGIAKSLGAIACKACHFLGRRKCDRPDQKELARLVGEVGYSSVGRMFGVSLNTVKKWLKDFPLTQPEECRAYTADVAGSNPARETALAV